MLVPLFALACVCWVAYAVRRILRQLNLFQIEEYNNHRFAVFLWRHRARLIAPAEVVPLLALCGAYSVAAAWIPDERQAIAAVFLVLWAGLYCALYLRRRLPPSKKPLVLTARARRLLGVTVVLAVALLLLVALATAALDPRATYALPAVALAGGAISIAMGHVVLIANGLLYPLEESLRRYYVRSATNQFRTHPGLQVVAVTGSYGKTSTKELIAHVLGYRYRVLKTPRSYNTLMGICKTIREELKPEHEVLVVEMGTYVKGEIARLCRLTPPAVGVLTAIGPQHLERFGTVERVAEAKYELMEALPADGVGIFNGDDALCRELAGRPARFATSLYGLDPSPGDLFASASGIQLSERGTEFRVTAAGRTVRFETALLGRHNVMNILAATCVALRCGMTLDEVAESIRSARPVEHRLERLAGAGGVTVIDDAYNSNPMGVQMALDVIAGFPGGRKILITPGMVELGDREEEEHRRMGRAAARVCDFVILVGSARTRAIAKGLRDAGFSPERLQVALDLADASRRLQTVVRPGDVVLFENDLPDTYETDIIYF